MPRPRIYDSTFRLLIYALKRANPGWGHARITAELEKRYGGEAPSSRTVSRFLQSIKASDESRTELNTPWRAWDEDNDEELQGATQYLLSVTGAILSLELFTTGDDADYSLFTSGLWDPVAGADPREDDTANVPELTKLEARWIARVHNAAPDLSVHDTFWTAQDVVSRVRIHGLMEGQVPFDCSDLHFLFATKPWMSDERAGRYIKLVRAGQIPPYRVTALRDLMATQEQIPAGLLTGFDERPGTRVSIPVPGEYSLISLFVKRQNPGLELIRRRALNNDFELT